MGKKKDRVYGEAKPTSKLKANKSREDTTTRMSMGDQLSKGNRNKVGTAVGRELRRGMKVDEAVKADEKAKPPRVSSRAKSKTPKDQSRLGGRQPLPSDWGSRPALPTKEGRVEARQERVSDRAAEKARRAKRKPAPINPKMSTK